MDGRTCKACGAAIVWVRTPSGLEIPLDVQPNTTSYLILVAAGQARMLSGEESRSVDFRDEPRYDSHLSTCRARVRLAKKPPANFKRYDTYLTAHKVVKS